MATRLNSVWVRFVGVLAVVFTCGVVRAETITASDFAQSMVIQPGSGKVSSTLTDFPVLVRLSAAAQSGFDPGACGVEGANIRFALEDGTLLAHEVDTWSLTGESCVWVNVPELTSSTRIVAYWGLKPGKTAPAIAHGAAWPKFLGVWHLSEKSGEALDSSTNRYDTTNASAVAASDLAIVGRSRNVQGGNFKTGITKLLDENASHPLTHVSKFTMSAWMRDATSTESGYRALFSKGGWGTQGWYANTQNNRTSMTAVSKGSKTKQYNFPNSKSLNGAWRYITISYDNGKVKGWCDGAAMESSWASLDAVNESESHELMFAGGLTGYFDEARLMDGPTSDAFAAADYGTQTDKAFLSYGAVTGEGPVFATEEIAIQYYKGSACTPSVVVRDAKTCAVLTEGTHYQLTYSDNTSVGSAAVRIVGLGTYAGSELLRGFNIVQPIYVKRTVATEGDGTSWSSPMSLTNALAQAAEGLYLLLEAGEYVVSKQLVFAKSITVKGGLAGTDDTTLAADPVSTFNAYNNSAFYSMVSVTTASGAGNVFERICFTRGYVRGLVKTGAANISFKDCRFYQNGQTYNPGEGFSGVGAHLTGTSAVEARFDNCIFDYNARTNYPGNRNTCMQGAGFYATGFKRVFVDDCLFATNCGVMGISGEYGQDRGDGGGAIYVSGQPLTVRNTRFIANNTPGRSARGGTVRITGSSGGSAFSNCTFVANCTKNSSGTTSLGAPLSISSNATGDKYDIYGCTFAYNITASSTSAAGLTVDKGTVKVRNSIFYGNTAISITAHYGREIAVYSNGKLDIDYSLLTGSDDSYISSTYAANLTRGAHMIYGDPCFGTTLAQSKALKNGDYYNVKKYAELYAIDVHENALGTGYSKALDTGDPTSAYANEPAPNGSCVNLGAYGNTANAATSVAAAPTLVDTSANIIAFASDTKPTVTVTFAGQTNFNAWVKIEIGTNDFQEAGATALESISRGGLQSGESFALASANLFKPGSMLYVRVTVSSANQADQVFYASKKATGELPYYYGHGGGATVIHVREGASGLNTGKNWADAFSDFNSVAGALTADIKEVWISGKITSQMEAVSTAPTAPLVIRGGFHGDEDKLADRDEGTYATLNGKAGAYDMFSLNNVAAAPVTIERVIFERGASRGLYKKGAGNLDVIDCKFHANSWPNTGSTGRGMCLDGGTRVSVSNCVFRGNFMSGGGSSSSKGGGIYAGGVGRLYLDNTLFMTNGCNPGCGYGSSMSGRDQCGGGLLLLSGVPVTARNCRFVANRTPIRGDGGAIWLGGAGSAFTNCVFVGNQSTYAEGSVKTGSTSGTGGAIVVTLGSTAGTVDFEQCTLAYNLSDGIYVPGGLDVVKGTVRMHNSIIYSNTRGKWCTVGSDIAVKANGRLNLSYCRLTEEDGETGRPTTNTVTEASEGLITYDHVTFGDPSFATSLADYQSLVTTGGDHTYLKYDATSIRKTTELDVHLCSPAGMMTNDGEWHTRETRLSNAIDKGDPDSPYANEPAPNGDKVNLGAYGNTAEASCCAKAQPEIASVVVTYPNGYARPLVTVTMGGNGTYFADVMVCCGQGDGEVIGYAYTNTYAGVLKGAQLTYFARRCVRPGELFSWKVTASAEDASDRTLTGSETVPLELVIPPFDGTGGGEHVVHVWPEAVGGNRDGQNWWDGYATVAEALVHVTSDKSEIWITHGTNQLPTTIANSKGFPIAIRAGFGPLDCSPADRDLANASIVNPGCGANTLVSVSGSNGVTLDGFVMTGAVTRAIYKSGAGDFTLLNSQLRVNGAKAQNTDGRGLYATGSSANIAVSNCVFAGNIYNPGWDSRNQGGGCGIYATSCKRLILDDTLFITNGLAGGILDQGIGGWAFYANATPVTARHCRFLGNKGGCRDYSSSYMGGVVRLDGACGGSAFTNCLWTGNWEFAGNGNGGTYGGTLTLNLSSVESVVELQNCTLAYNFVNNNGSPGGINIVKGTLKLNDSIVYGNMIGTYGVGANVAKDIAVKANGRLEIGYALVTDTTSYYIGGDRANISYIDECVRTGDPSFVTPTAAAQAQRGDYGLSGSWKNWVTNDLHLLSLAGNWCNDGTLMTGAVHSVAIDAGDPNVQNLKEPFYNGDRLNLGVYGNTSEASLSPHGQPRIGEITVNYPHGYTRPEFSVPMGSALPGEVYSATVTLVCKEGDVTIAEKTFAAVANGTVLKWVVPYFFENGAQVTLDVSFTSPAAEPDPKSQPVTIAGTKPSWANRGGGATVIHIWDGATNGLFLGTSWADAFTNLTQAVAAGAFTIEKTDVWFAGERIPLTVAPTTITIHNDMLIAGGFAGVENAAAERSAGTRTTLDGKLAYDAFRFSVDSGKTLTLERLNLNRGVKSMFRKEGSGHFTIRDCDIRDNGPTSEEQGRGLYIAGGSASEVVIERCNFIGNAKNSSHQGSCQGSAFYVTTAKHLTVDDSLFVSNGATWSVSYGWGIPGHDRPNGVCCYINSAPTTMRNCQFFANRGGIRGDLGGIFRMDGNCGGSAFTNCVWMGNQNTYAEGDRSGHTGVYGGCIVIAQDAKSRQIDFEHCTIAYNLGDSNYVPGGFAVVKGTVNLHNSIVYGNVRGNPCKVGADFSLRTDGVANLDYVRLTGTSTNYVTTVTDGSFTANNISFGDPNFVTEETNFLKRVKHEGSYTYLANGTTDVNFYAGMNAHLASFAGYYDAAGRRAGRRTRRTSDCLDAGDPASPYAAEPDVNQIGTNGRRANLGAYGNTREATMTPLRGAFLRFR